jgi:hypothetical protein
MAQENTQQTVEQPANQLTEAQLDKLKEVRIPISLKGFFKAWYKVTHKKPIAAYQTLTRRIEGHAKKMMTGKTSLFGMPFGLVFRNASRAAYNLSDNKYGGVAAIAGGLAVAAAVAGATMVGGPLIAGGALAWLGYAAAAPVAGLVLHSPVYTATKLLTSSVIAAGAGVFSALIIAPANLKIAYRRSKVSLSGADLQKQLAADEEKFNRRSPSANYEREMEKQARYALRQLPDDKKEGILKEFAQVAQPVEQTAAAAGTPKTKGPQGPA